MRQRLERHRANPSCAACHSIMDPIGFALENFDLVGQWREADGGRPVNAAGRFVDGTELDRTGEPAAGVARPSRPVCRHGHREAADLRARPERRVLRHAGRPVDRPATRREKTTGSRRSWSGSSRAAFQMKADVSRSRIRETSSNRTRGCIRTRGIMFISKKHLPRRTFLKGAGRVAGAAAAGIDDPGGHGARPARPRRRRPGSGASTSRTARRWTSGRPPPKARGSTFPKSCSRSSRFAIVSASSATWRTRPSRHGRARTRAGRKTTCARLRCS